jgi:hypothetical protein
MTAEALEEMERLSNEAAALSKIVTELRPADARAGKRKKKRRQSKLTSSATSVASSVTNSPRRSALEHHSMPPSLATSPLAKIGTTLQGVKLSTPKGLDFR